MAEPPREWIIDLKKFQSEPGQGLKSASCPVQASTDCTSHPREFHGKVWPSSPAGITRVAKHCVLAYRFPVFS